MFASFTIFSFNLVLFVNSQATFTSCLPNQILDKSCFVDFLVCSWVSMKNVFFSKSSSYFFTIFSLKAEASFSFFDLFSKSLGMLVALMHYFAERCESQGIFMPTCLFEQQLVTKF